MKKLRGGIWHRVEAWRWLREFDGGRLEVTVNAEAGSIRWLLDHMGARGCGSVEPSSRTIGALETGAELAMRAADKALERAVGR